MGSTTFSLPYFHYFSRCLTLFTLLVLAGCGASNQIKRVDHLTPTNGQVKIAMMPLDVELSKLTAAGLLEPNAEWTENAKQHMTAAVNRIMEEKGIQLMEYQRLSQNPSSIPVQLEKLHQAVGVSIQNASFAPLPSRDPKAPWTLGKDAALLKEKIGADYAVFFYVRDSYSTGGRVALGLAMALLGVGISGGTQYGFASLVDLNTGDVVWFNRLLNASGDLRTAEPAELTAKALLEGIPTPQ